MTVWWDLPFRLNMNNAMFRDNQKVRIENLTIESKFAKGHKGLYMVAEKVITIPKRPDEAHQVQAEAKRMPASTLRYNVLNLLTNYQNKRQEKNPSEKITFEVEVSSRTFAQDPRSKISLGTLRELRNKVATVDSAQVVLRIIANVPEVLTEEITALIELDFKITTRSKDSVNQLRKQWAAAATAQ